MIYMGSKARLANELIPIITRNRTSANAYVEPFCGGCNVICDVGGTTRIANDISVPLIEMWKQLVNENWIPEEISKEVYDHVRANKDQYPLHFVGWVGYACGFRGKYFGGYTPPDGLITPKNKESRNYQSDARRSILRQVPKLQGVQFRNREYWELEIPDNSVIYCDPPYQNTTEYKDDGFDHKKFWEWCREKAKYGHQVFISEYNAPDDFECVWSKDVKIALAGKETHKLNVERLYVVKSCTVA